MWVSDFPQDTYVVCRWNVDRKYVGGIIVQDIAVESGSFGLG